MNSVTTSTPLPLEPHSHLNSTGCRAEATCVGFDVSSKKPFDCNLYSVGTPMSKPKMWRGSRVNAPEDLVLSKSKTCKARGMGCYIVKKSMPKKVDQTTCKCVTPNAGTAGKNKYKCTNGKSGVLHARYIHSRICEHKRTNAHEYGYSLRVFPKCM